MNIKEFKQKFSGFILMFEKQTGKHAIYGGVITGGFVYWLKRKFPKVHVKYADIIKNLRTIDLDYIYEQYYITDPESSVYDLAKELGCGYQTIYNHMDKRGYSRRNNSEAQLARYKKKKYLDDLNKRMREEVKDNE